MCTVLFFFFVVALIGKFDSPCTTSAVCPVFSLWTTCTQRSWTGRGCRKLCQKSLGSGTAGREICNTRGNTSCFGSNSCLLPCLCTLSHSLLCFYNLYTITHSILHHVHSLVFRIQRQRLTVQVYPEVWHSPCLLRI